MCEQACHNCHACYNSGRRKCIPNTVIIHESGLQLYIRRQVAQCDDRVANVLDNLEDWLVYFDTYLGMIEYLIFVGDAR